MRAFAPVLVAFLLLALLASAPARAEEPSPDPGATLREMLENGTPDGNTIPIEKEILRLRDAKEGEAIAALAGHRRWGTLLLWALASVDRPAHDARMLEVFGALEIPARAEASLWVARRATEPVRAALRALAAAADLPPHAAPRVRAALLRAGDESTAAAAKKALAGTDAGAAADALLALGDARLPEVLSRAAALLGDRRPLDEPRASRFEVRVRTEIPGGYSETTTYPELKALGEVAREAANRAVLPDTPEMIAWWYEVEESPRFAAGEEGAKLLKDLLAADAKAAKARAPSANAAIEAFGAHLRATREEGTKFRVRAVAFDRTWTVTGEVMGEAVTARVDATGKVTMD